MITIAFSYVDPLGPEVMFPGLDDFLIFGDHLHAIG
jgi:hypothetical protein